MTINIIVIIIFVIIPLIIFGVSAVLGLSVNVKYSDTFLGIMFFSTFIIIISLSVMITIMVVGN